MDSAGVVNAKCRVQRIDEIARGLIWKYRLGGSTCFDRRGRRHEPGDRHGSPGAKLRCAKAECALEILVLVAHIAPLKVDEAMGMFPRLTTGVFDGTRVFWR